MEWVEEGVVAVEAEEWAGVEEVGVVICLEVVEAEAAAVAGVDATKITETGIIQTKV